MVIARPLQSKREDPTGNDTGAPLPAPDENTEHVGRATSQDSQHLRQDFCQRLRQLRTAAGAPTYQALVNQMEALDPPPTVPSGRSSVRMLLRGDFVRTPPWGRIEAFVRACDTYPGGRVSPDEANLEIWWTRHTELAVALEAELNSTHDVPEWEVALSFAGAQRRYVEKVAAALTGKGVRCFYDANEQIDLWGKFLAEELPAVYGGRSATVVVFVSAEYARRDWTRLERRVALNQAVRERREYVLPARFDDTPLPGLLSDLVAIDLRTRSPEEFATMITAKLRALGIWPTVSTKRQFSR